MARPGDVWAEQINKRKESERDLASTIAKEKAKQIMEGLIGGTLESTADPQESIVSEQAPLKPRNIGELIKSGLGMPTTEEKMYKRTGTMTDTQMKSELLKREYETALGKNRPPQATGISEGLGMPIDTAQPADKGEPQPFIQIQTGIDKYGNPEYTTKENPEYSAMQKQQEKIADINVKKIELRKEINNFGVLNNQIKRAKGGFMGTTGAGLRTKTIGLTQPIDPKTGKATQESVAIRNYEGAKNRLRLKLVRAAGDVGNIAVVEQEAQEKLVPNYFDSEEAANGKMQYMYRLTEAINNEDSEAIKKVFDDAGINYTDFSQSSILQGSSNQGNYESFLKDLEQ